MNDEDRADDDLAKAMGRKAGAGKVNLNWI
jgi:hypothetical protein